MGRRKHCGERKDKLAGIGGGLISRLAAVEGLPDPAHPARHRKIAHAHFTKTCVHVAAKTVENFLSQPPQRCSATVEPPHQEDGVQHNHFESPSDRIGNAITLVKDRRAPLRHDGAI